MAERTSPWRFRDTFDLNLIGATHGLSDGFSNLLVPVLTLIVADLDFSTLEAGILLSVFSVSTFLFLYPISMLADYSGRKKEMLIAGMGLSAGAFLAMSRASDLYSLAALAFVAGAGNATYHPCGTALTAERFVAHRAVALSLHGLWGNLGVSLMPLLQAAVAAMAGWRAAIAACVLPATVLLPLVGLRFPKGRQAGGGGPAKADNWRKQLHALTAKVLKNRHVVLLGLVYALKGLESKGLVGFLPLLAAKNFGMDTAAIGLAISLYYGAGVVAKPLMGLLYNRWGARSALFIPLLLTGALALTIGFTPWQTAFMVLVTLIGVVSPISPIIMTAAADLSPEDTLASSIGFIYTCQGLGFLSPLLGGWLAQQLNLEVSYVFFALAVWAGAGVSTLLPKKIARNRR